MRYKRVAQRSAFEPEMNLPYVSRRERRLYVTLSVVLGLNFFVIFGALTFFALILHQ